MQSVIVLGAIMQNVDKSRVITGRVFFSFVFMPSVILMSVVVLNVIALIRDKFHKLFYECIVLQTS
jgi:hypothetical protein